VNIEQRPSRLVRSDRVGLANRRTARPRRRRLTRSDRLESGIRGEVGVVLGLLMTLLTMLRGLDDAQDETWEPFLLDDV
jgi:hypothetical protein